ncbi:MAG: Blue-light-activated protein [Syntrophorhabdaceae bacterium PtaU1.Bin034]|nr:MAG: Blue-light-activated protein [Syntrophorhabdaceae bacterium PtaU1.Bin034]
MDLRRMKIGTRLSAGMTLILIFMLVLIILGLSSMRIISEKMNHAVRVTSVKTWYAGLIKDAKHTMDEAVLTALLTGNDTGFEHVRVLTARATYQEALEQLEKLDETGKGKELLAKLRETFSGARVNSEKILQLVSAGRNMRAIEIYHKDLRPAVLRLEQLSTELVAHEQEMGAFYYRQALERYKMTRNLFLAMGFMIVAIAVAAAVILTRSITRPLKEGVEIANRLAKGDLAIEIRPEGRDESTQLFSAMKNMVEKLRQIKVLEQQLLQSQRLETVGRLAGGIAHDFNNLLSIMLGNAELMKLSLSPQSLSTANTGGGLAVIKQKIYERCESIETAVSRAKDFVKQLLVFSKHQVLELRTVDLNQVVLDFEKMMRRMVGEHIEMSIECLPGLPAANLDVGQINQVLLNLVVNAREAMPRGGKITIETSFTSIVAGFTSDYPPDAKPGNYLCLTVRDTGSGMEASVVDKIFDPFFTTKESGTGLGLSVVYGIIKKHGGFTRVKTEKGVGTSFEAFFPSTSDMTMREAETAKQLVRGKETILLMEDDDELRPLVSDVLTVMGYEVLAAADGAQGLSMFRERSDIIDLVITDMIMPKIGGLEAWTEIRKLRPDIDCLVITGYAKDASMANLDGQYSHFMQKPFTLEALSEKIREILDGDQSRTGTRQTA